MSDTQDNPQTPLPGAGDPYLQRSAIPQEEPPAPSWTPNPPAGPPGSSWPQNDPYLQRSADPEAMPPRVYPPSTVQNGGQGSFAPQTPASPSSNPQQPQSPYYAQPVPQVAITAGPEKPSLLHKWRSQGGILGGIATVLLLLAKIGGPLLALLKVFPILKILLTAGSMFVSIWLYAKLAHLGWAFGIGIVALIFIHECGHALAGRMRGMPTSMMVFIPFMGAFVTLKRGGRNIGEDAFIGIMGPVFGTLASLACLAIYFVDPIPFWLYLAAFGFWINLFNLAPTAPLDGGWIVPLFSPKLLAVGVVLLILLGFRNPLIWILGLLSLPRIIGGWKADTRKNPYYQATPAERWGIGLGYFGLALFLLFLFNVLGGFGTAYAMWGR